MRAAIVTYAAEQKAVEQLTTSRTQIQKELGSAGVFQ